MTSRFSDRRSEKRSRSRHGGNASATGQSHPPSGLNITVRLLGTPGRTYRFQASTDLISWVRLDQASAGANGLLEFTDHGKLLYHYRFFRVAE